jgi:murein DD-endopeptidase MepM/ murein hydrolase activator NlpD
MRLTPSTVLTAWLAAIALLSFAGRDTASAQEQVPPPIVLGSPVDCAIPEVCWVQNYYDHDPGPGAEDYTCGRRAYDRHRGIDIRVANLEVMRKGIPVIASADGVVAGTRDGMPDTGIVDADPASVRGKECGNGVAIRHKDGWITQYCHLLEGSIAVAKGQEVRKGDRLALIGLSGLTEFPHVHLEVRNGSRSIDPFVGYEATGKCGTAGKPLFENAFLEKTPYVETGLLNAGFTDRPPKGKEVLQGEHVNETLPVDAPALIYWVELFGTQPGDRDRFTIRAPDGRVIVQQTRPAQEGHSARHLAYSGLRRPQNGWLGGEYQGTFELLRDEVGETKVAFQIERSIVIGTPQTATLAAATSPTATTAPPPAQPSRTEAGPQAAAPAQSAPPASPAPAPSDPRTDESATAEQETQVASAEDDSGFSAAHIAERAAELLPTEIPTLFKSTGGQKGPPPWQVAAGLLLVILGVASIAYITRR